MKYFLQSLCFVFIIAHALAAEDFYRRDCWGDQSDGTYINPILNADYPDVDIERVGDTFYMMTSTIHYAPGMTLLTSKDLVNWELAGHVFEKLDWHPRYDWKQMDGYRYGVWAGDLAYHEGQWYCYFIDFHCGLYVSTAEKFEGPWTPAKQLADWTKTDDPAVYWDEETKQGYLIANRFRYRDSESTKGRKAGYENRLYKLSWDGMKLEDNGVPVYYGPGAEAAKIYKIDNTYYIFMAEWRDGDRKQIALRSNNIYGPYERKVIMEMAPGEYRSVCQGALLQAPNDSWWLSHQYVQHRDFQAQKAGVSNATSYQGRMQGLVPVKWKDDWPTIPHDPDNNGIGNTIHTAIPKPVKGHTVKAPVTNDNFDSPKLGHQWQWNHNPRDDRWSLTERPGFLRLYASKPVNKQKDFWGAPNTISQRLMGSSVGVATCKIDLSGMTSGQVAGFCRHSGNFALLGVRADKDSVRTLFFERNGNRQYGPTIKHNEIWLRTHNDGPVANFEYSHDGVEWIRLGPEFPLSFGNWRGDRPGFFTWNPSTDDKLGYIDIDWFRYNYQGPSSNHPRLKK